MIVLHEPQYLDCLHRLLDNSLINENVQIIKDLITEDRHLSCRQLLAEAGINRDYCMENYPDVTYVQHGFLTV